MTRPRTKNATRTRLDWVDHSHALAHDEVALRLGVDPGTGLSADLVATRLVEYGPNTLPRSRPPGIVSRFADQLKAPLVLVLLLSMAVAGILGHWSDASVILGVVVLNAIIGVVQESRAQRALELLAQSVAVKAHVLRQGRQLAVDSAELVPGDIVILTAGDHVPADLRLMQTRDLSINESALTGEAAPAAKSATAAGQASDPLGDRLQMAFASTLVTSGHGRGLVVATGLQTEIGRVAQLVKGVESLETPLVADLRRLANLILALIGLLAALNFLTGLARGMPLIEILMATVAMAVGAVPEGLPAAVTIALALGVHRMAKRRAVIRKLPAVETLGCTSVICSDKTGTLTENRMTVQESATAQALLEMVSRAHTRKEPLDPAAQRDDAALVRCAVLCNDAPIVASGDHASPLGDPVEQALVLDASQRDPNAVTLREIWPRVHDIPFAPERQFMATWHRQSDGRASSSSPDLLCVKGSPETILELCDRFMRSDGQTETLSAEHRYAIECGVRRWTASGLRVLACAEARESLALPRETGTTDQDLPPGQHEMRAPLNQLPHTSYVYLGIYGLVDPPRAEARESVLRCQSAGIEVKMITGDHADTAFALARRVGIVSDSDELRHVVLTGKDMASLDSASLARRTATAKVFARITPEQKLMIIRALQRQGQVTAMTGDGVNDAPALRQADLGIAMGLSGTAVARESADMVLLDDNFATIVNAVEEGRGVYANLQKFLAWTLPTNLAEGLIILVAVVLGVQLPILPVQILWINMTTAVFLGLTLAFEPIDLSAMKHPPRSRLQPILQMNLLMRIALVSALALCACFGMFLWSLDAGLSEAQARTVAVHAMVGVEIFYLFNCRSLDKSFWSQGMFSNPWLNMGVLTTLLLQALFTYWEPMQKFFGTAPIPAWPMAGILGGGIMTLIVIGLEKRVQNYLRTRRHLGRQQSLA